MQIHLEMLLSDWLIYGLLIIAIIALFYIRRRPHLREPLRQLFQRGLAMTALVVLVFYVVIGLLDSVHFEVTQKIDGHTKTEMKSLLDLIVSPLGEQDEKTYSAPFATHLYSMEIVVLPDGREIQGYPRLQFGGAHLKNPDDRGWDIAERSLLGFFCGIISFVTISWLLVLSLARRHRARFFEYFRKIRRGKTPVAWGSALSTFGILWILLWIVALLVTNYHILGTDKVGGDIFYATLKSIRTGLLIGTLTSLFMLPFALVLGMLAGFFSGWVDDVIQYLYTTLSSIPGVLLIAASVLVMQVYIATHADYFTTLAERADVRLLALCFILGITSWANLCRLLRGETLKLREQEFVDAARVMGVGSWKTIFRHIMPNVMHIVLITMVLDFSGLVLAEAVLSYVGVGVDPTTFSWGNMINSSRLELAREPIVWWPLLAALVFMFLLVLAANLFADAVRDALDPRLRKIEEE